MKWRQAARAEKMNPPVIREILNVTEKPGIISFAGGLPSPKTFPIDAFAAACATVLATDGEGALQYAASEGYTSLRQWVADCLPWDVDASHAVELPPQAVERNVAYVPGAAFYSAKPELNTLPLSFLTASVEKINVGVAALAQVLKANMVRKAA